MFICTMLQRMNVASFSIFHKGEFQPFLIRSNVKKSFCASGSLWNCGYRIRMDFFFLWLSRVSLDHHLKAKVLISGLITKLGSYTVHGYMLFRTTQTLLQTDICGQESKCKGGCFPCLCGLDPCTHCGRWVMGSWNILGYLQWLPLFTETE